jgi:sigma-B regulation protein RsbU (phosphoserine phosphatase)
MATPGDHLVRPQLLQRRQKLGEAISRFEGNADLHRLLGEVDAALERLDDGSYGLCDGCHEPVEQDRLMADPVIRFCLDCLTPREQAALEQDLGLASQVQTCLLPDRHIEFAGWEIFYHFEPAGPVSGDYYDFMKREQDQVLHFFLGDVSGKGVAASMLMTQLHAMFRSLIALDLPLNELNERVNRLFCEATMSGHYATLISGRAHSGGDIELCNAGHCLPLLVRGGTVTSLDLTHLPIGLFCVGGYAIQKLELSKGDTLLLYTDGLTEARNTADVEYEVGRLSEVLERYHSLAPRELVKAILDELGTFLSGLPKADDVTIAAIRRMK